MNKNNIVFNWLSLTTQNIFYDLLHWNFDCNLIFMDITEKNAYLKIDELQAVIVIIWLLLINLEASSHIFRVKPEVGIFEIYLNSTILLDIYLIKYLPFGFGCTTVQSSSLIN